MSDNYDPYNNGNYNDRNGQSDNYGGYPQNDQGVRKGNEYSYESSSFDQSYEYSSDRSAHQKKQGSHRVLKAVVCLLLLTGVGAGSVQAYKFLNETKKELAEYTGESSKSKAESKTQTQDKTEPESEAENLQAETDSNEELPSLIQLASRSDAKPLPDIVEEIMPSVVGVSSTFEYEYSQPSFSMWGWNTTPQTQQAKATGTGFIITDDGYIVTNAHVIYDESEYNAGLAIEVSVLFSDETEHEAKIIAYDKETDIAVLKVNEKGLTPAILGDSDELRVGELVIAVGNPLGFDLFGSVTSGIVSALNRQISINEKNMTLIQTDAAINNGNSGGPLLNSCGQVIGINSAKMSSNYGSASVEGLGFAIPMKEAKVIIDDLINYNYVKGRPQIGISTVDVNESYSRYLNIPMGVYVRTVEEGSAAEQAGILEGDIIIGIENEPITTIDELTAIKNKFKAGDTIKLTLSRNGTDVDVNVKLQEERNPLETKDENPLEKDPDISNN
ncbi:MAG: trypsin-like peptidase domain-containing protein [Ruminococcus flavefaciens]